MYLPNRDETYNWLFIKVVAARGSKLLSSLQVFVANVEKEFQGNSISPKKEMIPPKLIPRVFVRLNKA